MLSRLVNWVKKVDHAVIPRMRSASHQAERFLIAVVFVWFGSLKVFGEISATSIIAKSVYWWDPSWVVPSLGVWEIAMGLGLLSHKTIRLSLMLFFLRLPGTFLALLYHWDECFEGSLLVPSIQGQYLIKELTLVGAALVIGGALPYLRKESSSQQN